MRLENAIEKIEKIQKTNLNDDQKEICKNILKKTAIDNEIDDKIFQFIIPNIKLGFVFDMAPETQFDKVSIVKEIKKMNINNPTDQNCHNLIIGENYDALKNLKLLYEKKINVIYIDPPYNTEKTKEDGNDYKKEVKSDKFIYRDKFKRTGWLNMMNERLKLARDLLSDNGMIFISIDDAEQAYLKILCDEIFDEQNFIGNFYFIRNPGGQSDNKFLAKTYEYVLFYCKDRNNFKIKKIEEEINILDYTFNDENDRYEKIGSILEKTGSNDRIIDRKNMGYVVWYNPDTKNIEIDEDCVLKDKINQKLTIEMEIYDFGSKKSIQLKEKGFIPIIPRKIHNTYGRWRIGAKKFLEMYKEDKWVFKKNKNVQSDEWKIYQKIICDEYSPYHSKIPKDTIDFTNNSKATSEIKKIFGNKKFDTPKPTDLIYFLINLHPDNNIIVLDFFAGSGTTGQAVMELNEEDNGSRKFILCTNNENNIAKDITWERLYRIVHGKGSKNEIIDWQYTDDQKSFVNNKIRVFEIEQYSCGIDDNSQEILKTLRNELSKFDSNFQLKDNFCVLNAIGSLKPYKED